MAKKKAAVETEPKTNGEAPRPKKAKQQYLSEDMAPPKIKAIDDQAERYVELRDRRMAALKDECEAKDALMGLMKKHSLPAYDCDAYTVLVSSTTDLRVKRKKGGEEGEDE